MDRVIFYSWQSDLPNATNRGFIQRALENVANAIAADTTNDHVPIVDRDTQGVPGAPNIAKTIFEKIDGADVLVADVSTIGSIGDQSTPNPNVLIELGYALCSLGDKQIVLVINTAYGTPEHLPFDLKMHRVMTYNMPESSTDRAAERLSLEKKLDLALRAALAGIKPERPSVTEARVLLTELTGPQSGFYLTEPNSGVRSEQYYKFVCAPYDDSAARPLTKDVEEQFRDSIIRSFGNPPPEWPPKRGVVVTTFQREGSINRKEQRLALTASCVLGFVTPAYDRTWDGRLFFLPTEFLYDLVCFLGAAALFYQSAEYSGSCRLQVDLQAPTPANVPSDRSTHGVLVPSTHLFAEPLASFRAEISLQVSVDPHPLAWDTIKGVLARVMLEIARSCDRVLSATFDHDVRPIVDEVLKRITPSRV